MMLPFVYYSDLHLSLTRLGSACIIRLTLSFKRVATLSFPLSPGEFWV
jgi:hypothetical protein